jgi:hypothetical protein
MAGNEEVFLAYETVTCMSVETSRTLCLLLKLLADDLFGREAGPSPLAEGLSLRDLYHYKSPALRPAHGAPSTSSPVSLVSLSLSVCVVCLCLCVSLVARLEREWLTGT